MEAELHQVTEILFSELWCQTVVNGAQKVS